MVKLHQLIAVERGGVEGRAKRRLTDLHHLLATPVVLAGITRRHHSEVEDIEDLPAETTLVQVTVPAVLAEVSTLLTRVYDLAATKEASNASAVASVMIDDEVLLPDMPVGALLFLEKRLDDVRTLIRELPVLDPAETWEQDANQIGVWRTLPKSSISRTKVTKVLELAPATDKFAAQVSPYQEDIRTGLWTTIKYSGAVPLIARSAMLDRIEKLIAAIKMAREEANEVEVVEKEVGRRVFQYVFGPQAG